MDFLIFVISIAILITGADMVIRSTNALALKLNISHLLVGAFLVAIGTSLPEMGIAMQANNQNKSDLAMAIIVGSSILNLTLIFGSIFIFSKSITIKQECFTQDALWLLAALTLFVLALFDHTISYFDALVVVLLMGVYTLFIFESSQKSRGELFQEILKSSLSLPYALMLFGGGIILLVVGAIFTVDSTSDIASRLNLNEWQSGILMIAFATALPELILSLLAVYKDKIEIAIANILGSTISNLTLVLALVTAIKPITFDLTTHLFDLIVMLLASLIVMGMIITKSYNRYIALSLFLILALFIEAQF